VGRSVFSFALGSGRLYRMIDSNQAVSACPVDYTNLPHNIARNHKVVSINNTTQIDLQDRQPRNPAAIATSAAPAASCSSYAGVRVRGRKVVSVPVLDLQQRRCARKSHRRYADAGHIVTTPRTDTMYVVTEFGIVNLKGKSVAERAVALISIATRLSRRVGTRSAPEEHHPQGLPVAALLGKLCTGVIK